jgi:spermidine/putrescine transport system ATP-binding protein
VSLDIPPGAYVVLLGPSGSGKTTLLNVLGGFLAPDTGTVEIEGRDVTALPPAKRPTTTVFQDYALFPHMTVGGNVGFGLRMRGIGRPERDRKALDALRLVGLDEAFARKPHQLSGGQRQRVALARALVVDPLVLLLDEPLGALDLKLRRQMQDELKTLQKRVGTTFVHVTHDQEEAMALADLLVVMNHGRIEDMGPPERVYARPASLFTAAFMGEITTFEGAASAAGRLDTELGILDRTGALAAGTPVTIAVRPENMDLATASAGTLSLGELTVREVVFQGPHKRLLGDLAGTRSPVAAIVRVPAAQPVAAGDRLPVAVKPADLLIFPKAPQP